MNIKALSVSSAKCMGPVSHLTKFCRPSVCCGARLSSRSARDEILVGGSGARLLCPSVTHCCNNMDYNLIVKTTFECEKKKLLLFLLQCITFSSRCCHSCVIFVGGFNDKGNNF